ncbi:MAG TPA: hypothetical protein VLA04_03105 [Verrucomicrobiae bacterium]|nr:hypothetical protein [Verrucomicrobiae bacterium]
MLLIHVLVALLSLAATAFTYVSPTKRHLAGSSALVALTLATGTALVLQAPSHLVEACSMGLAFLAISFVGIFAARKKLATATILPE